MMRRSHDPVTSQKIVRPNSSIVLGYKYLYLCTDVTIYFRSFKSQLLQKHSTELDNSSNHFFKKQKGNFFLPVLRGYNETVLKTEHAGLALHVKNTVAKDTFATRNDKGFHKGWMILNCRYWNF